MGSKQRGSICIWCGQSTVGAEDGASFLFLAKRGLEFTSEPDRWMEDSPHKEGHQFFCHIACFRTSVPDALQYGLSLALDEP